MRYERLEVWKRSCQLSVDVYRCFSDIRDFGFKDQITRCSLSIASNIAKGVEKESDKEKMRFIEIAKGSSAELMTQTYIGIEIGYIDKSTGIKWVNEVRDILRMLNGLIKNYRR